MLNFIGKNLLIRKVIKLIGKFFADDISYYAASLSFFTIFSVLPIIALAIASLTYLPDFNEYANTFSKYLFNMLNPTNSQEIVETLQKYVANSNKLGWVGTIYMLFVFLMFVRNYDYIVNKIHNVKNRSIHKTFVYLIYFIFLPISFIAYNILTAIYSSGATNLILSYLISWCLFFALFKVTVNTKINNYAAIYSSFVTLFVLTVTKNLFIYYVVYNKTYSTIYGSLATLLFTFLWIYVSWTIYLYGVKFCHELNMTYKNKENNFSI